MLEVEEQLMNLKSDESIYQPLVVLFYTGFDPKFEPPSWESVFPLPQLLQVEKLRKSQINFCPLCVNLTRLFLEDNLNPKDFLRVMPEIMARASLKKLDESYSTLFNALGQIDDWIDENAELFAACLNYVTLAADKPMTPEEVVELSQSANNKKASERMKSFIDIFKDEGIVEGKIEGKIETIQTVASLRFPETSKRLAPLLTKLNDLKLLEQIRQFALTAPSLLAIENYAENLTPVKPKVKRIVKRQAL